MKEPANPQPNTRPVASLEIAIDRWLAARENVKAAPTDENQHAYNATLFALGEAWAKRYPEGVTTPEAFEWFRRGLIAPEEE